jgi:hypothetical protein
VQEYVLMLYRHCPRCRLAIRCRTGLLVEHCPRCLARAGILTSMFSSPLDAMQLRAGRDGDAGASSSDDTAPVSPGVRIPAPISGATADSATGVTMARQIQSVEEA